MDKHTQQLADIRNHLKYGQTKDALVALMDMIEEQMAQPVAPAPTPPVTDQAPLPPAESQTAE